MKSSLSPAYWGSLGALIVGLILIAIAPLWGVLPEHVSSVPEGYRLPIFYLTLALVFVLTLRYYGAIAVNMYGGSPTFIYKMPPRVRILVFVLMCFLVLGCGIAARVHSGVSISGAIIICIITSLASLTSWLCIYVSAQYMPEDVTSAPATFAVVDIFIAVFCGWIMWDIWEGVSYRTVLDFSVITALTIVLVVEDFRHIYRTFSSQLDELRRELCK